MSDDRARRLAQLRDAYESGFLDEDTYRAAVAALEPMRDVEASLEGGGAIAQDDSTAAGAGGVAVRGDVHGDVIVVADPDLLWRDIRRRSVRPLQRTTDDKYDLGAVRILLRDAFTAKGLWRFCQNRAAFRPLLADLPHDYSLEDLIDRLLEYSHIHDLLDELLAEVQKVNERQYARHAARLQRREAPPAEPGVPPTLPREPAPLSSGLRQATERYLKHVVDRYRYLEFKGMGVSDRVALRLPLVEMYIPLKARIELPEGETWARQLHLAGRSVSEEEAEAMGQRLSEPAPTLDLLQQHDGLIVLGDPGAGKTTFLKYLALRLAMGQGDDLGLQARLPVLLPLSAYANALANGDVPLHRFITEYYQNRGVDLPLGPMLDEALARGGALLLLDGLDEVRDLGQRLLVVQRVVDFFSYHRGQGNKFVLTSRIVGYREVRPTTEGLAECTLVDFDEEEIGQFVDRWTAALERAARGDTPVAAREAERERGELLASVQRNPGVRRLAANPLLLTILALMKRQGVVLPERRIELYQKYVETLLKHWNLARGLGRPPTHDLDVVETVRVLAPLALWMHQTSPGVGLVKREAMKRRLVEIYRGRGHAEPEQAARQLLADVRGYAVLLLERGPGEYGFIHLTFQEYLAAVALALGAQREVGPLVEKLAAHVGDDNWREVSLLAIGYMGIVQQRDEAAGVALWDLIQAAPGEPGQAAVLAGEAVVDAWPGGVSPACKEQVVGTLLETMIDDTRVNPRLRAASGRALAQLGDPRPEVMTVEGMQFCYVPHGPFWMGEGDDEHRNECLDYGYWVARHPVTVAQYQPFMEEGGYREQRYWTKAGWLWREKRGLLKPHHRDEPWSLANHPMVDVSWYEAVAYCQWLSAWMGQNGLLPEGRAVRLPSEAEWEKAARGGEEIPVRPVIWMVGAHGRTPLQATPLRGNPHPRRAFPWGEEPDLNLANYDETGINTTSAVGCFPGGSSPYGVKDLSGNVWEWCATKWRESCENSADESLEGDALRVLRGGSFFDNLRFVCCANCRGYGPSGRNWSFGFRVVVAPVPSGL